jgi:hypothetical protein
MEQRDWAHDLLQKEAIMGASIATRRHCGSMASSQLGPTMTFDDDNFTSSGGPGRAFYQAKRKLGRRPTPEEVQAEAAVMEASTVTVNKITHYGTTEELGRYNLPSHGKNFWYLAHTFAWEASKDSLIEVWIDEGHGGVLEARYQNKVNITER